MQLKNQKIQQQKNSSLITLFHFSRFFFKLFFSDTKIKH
jgi:hypothetical protein